VIKGFNHVGIAVKDLKEAITFFENTYGARLVWKETYTEESFETALVAVGQLRFELLSGVDADSLVSKFIESRGEGIHHMSLEVDQFGQVISDLKEKGLTIMAETDTKDFKAAFIHPQGNFGVLTEIIEPKGGWGEWAPET
jgi:methylmalonyl-CoA/ethylmalonyl-CoA epimerase